jgi:hypothetical protein
MRDPSPRSRTATSIVTNVILLTPCRVSSHSGHEKCNSVYMCMGAESPEVITEECVAYYIESGDSGVEMSNLGWCNAVLLAQRFGWDVNGIALRHQGGGGEQGNGGELAEGREVGDEEDQSDQFISATNAKAMADALEVALAIIRARNPSHSEATAARDRVHAATCVMDPNWDTVRTEDLLDAFGHQRQLVESIIAVTRDGEVSIW